jgi:hypothetical protein
MKVDVRPLCDKHLVAMEAAGVDAKMGGTDVWHWVAFRCTRAGCLRLFDSGGYTTIADGSIDPGSRNFIGCEDGAMFIERIEGDRLIWRCSKAGCEQSRRTDRDFRPVAVDFLRHARAISGPPGLSSRKGFSRE